MENEVQKKPQEKVMELIRQTKPMFIVELEFVKEKFIALYNKCNKGNEGDLMYHRQLNSYKQLISGSEALSKCDPFSLYACFVTCAVKDYDLDPLSEEVYMIPKGGKALLWPQPAAHVKRLMQTGQIISASQPKLVYETDEFEEEDGNVMKHKVKFTSENIIAGYVKFTLDSRGTEKHIIYRRSDWLEWKKKSPQAGGENWSGGFNGQPMAGFLRSKILKHAAKDKSWRTGDRKFVEEYGVEVEDLDEKDYQVQDDSNVFDSDKPAQKPLKEVVKKTEKSGKVILVKQPETVENSEDEEENDFDEVEAEDTLTDKNKSNKGIRFDEDDDDLKM